MDLEAGSADLEPRTNDDLPVKASEGERPASRGRRVAATSEPSLESLCEPWHPTASLSALQRWRDRDADGFARAALRLFSTGRKGPWTPFVAALVHEHRLVNNLLQPLEWPLRDAVAVARQLTGVRIPVGARLAHDLFVDFHHEVKAIPAPSAVRLLRIVREVSQSALVLPYLVQLMRHPNLAVRCKTASLIGCANLNIKRAEAYLTGTRDSRLRTSVVTSLLPHAAKAVSVLRQAARDANPSVATHALIGLCQAQDPAGMEGLESLASQGLLPARKAVVRALGTSGTPEAMAILEDLLSDPEPIIRSLACSNLERLRGATCAISDTLELQLPAPLAEEEPAPPAYPQRGPEPIVRR